MFITESRQGAEVQELRGQAIIEAYKRFYRFNMKSSYNLSLFVACNNRTGLINLLKSYERRLLDIDEIDILEQVYEVRTTAMHLSGVHLLAKQIRTLQLNFDRLSIEIDSILINESFKRTTCAV